MYEPQAIQPEGGTSEIGSQEESRSKELAEGQSSTRHEKKKGAILVPSEEDLENFWKFVRKTDSCWLWTGRKNKSGYGYLQTNGVQYPAHRLSFQIHHGEILKGMCICHKCDVPVCVNPDHLWMGTHAENAHDRHLKGRTANGMYTHPNYGELNPNSFFTIHQVMEILSHKGTGRTAASVSRQFKCDDSTIEGIWSGRRWAKAVRIHLESKI